MQWCWMYRTSNLFRYTRNNTCSGSKISLFIKKSSDGDVCSYERSIRWTDTLSQHYFPLASAVLARAGLCSTKAEEWETSSCFYRDNSEYDQYDACGWWFLIATTDGNRRYFANHREEDYSLSFLSCNFCRVYAYTFTRNVPTGVLFALSGWFSHKWCNKLWATCCFFYFFDSRRSRLLTGLVSLLKTQPL